MLLALKRYRKFSGLLQLTGLDEKIPLTTKLKGKESVTGTR